MTKLSLKSRFLCFSDLPFTAICFTGGLSFCQFIVPGIAIGDYFLIDKRKGVVEGGPFQLAFPDDDDVPALGLQLAPDFLVAPLVTDNLFLPELGVGFGDRVVLAAFVAVPEAAVDEDDSAVFGKNDVWGTREALDVYAVAESEAPEGVTQAQFRLCGGGMNLRHDEMSLLL